MKTYSDITYRYLKLQKKRSILTVIGVTLSVALLTAIFTMMVSLRDNMIRDSIRINGDYHARFLEVPGDKVNKLSMHVDISQHAVAKRVGTAIIYEEDEETSKGQKASVNEKHKYNYMIISAYDNEAFKMRSMKLKQGRLPQSSEELVIDISSLGSFKTAPKIGDKIEVPIGKRLDKVRKKEMEDNAWSAEEVFEKTGEKEFTVVGISDCRFMSGFGTIVYGATYLDSGFINNSDKYNVYIKLNSTKAVYEKLEKIGSETQLPSWNGGGFQKYNIETNENLLRLYAQSLTPSTNEGVILVLIFIISLIIISTIAVIYNAFHISVVERISQFGILRCTGASPKQIRNIVFKEAGILSSIGIPLGLAAGIGAMELVMFIIGKLKYNFFGEDMRVVVSPLVFLLGAAIGIITVYLSSFGPARQAGRVSPLEAVRNTGEFKREELKKVKKSKLAGLIFGIEGQLAYKNLRRNRKRFRITVFSMVISITLYIVFSSFIGFVSKSDAMGRLDNVDFVVGRTSSKTESIEDKVFNDIKNIPVVEGVYKYRISGGYALIPTEKINKKVEQVRQSFGGRKIGDLTVLYNSSVLSYGDSSLEELKSLLREGKIDKETLNKENGVIVSKTGKLTDYKTNKVHMMDIADIKVGDIIKLNLDGEVMRENAIENIKVKEVKVLAIIERGLFYDDYNQNEGINLITTEEIFKKLTGIESYNNMYITLKNGADKEPVAKYLKELKEKDYTYSYSDLAEAAKESRQNAITIGIFLYGFVAVITLIGCLNIINTISTNLILRTRELSMLRAVGMAKGAIEKMICLEGIFYGIIAAVYGGLIGTALSYILFNFMMRIREFQWTMPWNHIIAAVLGAIFVALVSGIIPLKKVNEGSIIDHIRMEE
jgi:putative ABC transport system permease protein